MAITKEEFDEWREHPTTKKIFAAVSDVKNTLVDSLVYGSTIGQKADITHGLTARMVGHIEGLNQLLDIKFEEASE